MIRNFRLTCGGTISDVPRFDNSWRIKDILALGGHHARSSLAAVLLRGS